ncbi:transposase [Sporosarcina sp. P20a]|uniref:DUF6429 family protein n=1 Tax=Sporosarcina sp. P20a TaxID=2048256 RepID=UPI000C167139|nr:DUF6429 family protein [Sporosarcina sp. P20a]PIC86728.1 transposase [Sporosarcina sp. P20a]
MDQQIEELTLLLLYATSWKDQDFPEGPLRSWKGYSFDALNQLEEEDLIRGGRRSKSVALTKAGIAEAEALMKKYFPDVDKE